MAGAAAIVRIGQLLDEGTDEAPLIDTSSGRRYAKAKGDGSRDEEGS